MKRQHLVGMLAGAVLFVAISCLLYFYGWAPTHILVVNALPAQATDLALNNDCGHIRVTCLPTDEVKSFRGYDAVVLYARGLFLDEAQRHELQRAAHRGVPVFTNAWRPLPNAICHNLTTAQQDTLSLYFRNGCRQNYRNALRYLRHLATPHRWGEDSFAPPVQLPENLYYHQESGHYFLHHRELTDYLRRRGLYHENARKVALIAGVSFPMEGNRAHVDTLISRLTQAGWNVYPLAGNVSTREQMLRELHPDAVVYLPMGRLGSDSLITWLHDENILLFNPFPLLQPREQWLDVHTPVEGGTLTARVVVPEIDGGIAPFCIATQEENEEGYLRPCPEMERVERFVNYMQRCFALRDKPNSEKRVAICYFKSPGKDALLASGMEVVPSLYNFLRYLRREGYRVDGLPATLAEFDSLVRREGMVVGAYAPAAQEEFLRTAHPVWIASDTYEQWARRVLLPEKYSEVVERYGKAPGALLTQGDSLAVACLRFGNVLLFPQPRPALGEDEFKLVHGSPVAPPHSYLAPYLYVQEGFRADALLHFGTHGSLEFTPGKNAGQSQADWSDALTGSLPHFYYYTTGNVGEGIIAKRRTHAVLVTHLTPPYVESGMRQQYSTLLSNIHRLLEEGAQRHLALAMQVKQEAVRMGLHRDLGLDSLPERAYTTEELERLDAFTEEIANEKVTGAFYTLGEPYSERDLKGTTLAMAADQLAYQMARRDEARGSISTAQSKDFTYVAHHYLPLARRRISRLLEQQQVDVETLPEELRAAWNYREQLRNSTSGELQAMLRALSGGTVRPAPGGDVVLNPNVLPTGRNMYSVNAEATPTPQAWEEGKRLAEETLQRYLRTHGDYPRQVDYTFWAGEFISTEGVTLAQVFYMLGVEPVRDSQGRVVDLKLIPAEELGRPRVHVAVQVSGQLRDLAASRLKMVTEAIRLASEADDECYPNHVKEGTRRQEKRLLEGGASPRQAREWSVMRVFGPVNSGYSTGLLGYTENSGGWEDKGEIARAYLNNMAAVYGDEEHWGTCLPELLAAALEATDVVVQPRQSNTWGPLSLDHVYEFAGGLSLAVKTLSGKEPEAYMADYRNRYYRRMQPLKEAVAVEARSTLLNPTFIRERMKGGAGSAQMFGEIFRNVFGWQVMRPSALDNELLSDLYRLYVLDAAHLGIHDYFRQVNPAALQAMTAVLLECARKGYWKTTQKELAATAALHARVTLEAGAACTEFVCGNRALQAFMAEQLTEQERRAFEHRMEEALDAAGSGKEVVLKQQRTNTDGRDGQAVVDGRGWLWLVLLLAGMALVGWIYRSRRG